MSLGDSVPSKHNVSAFGTSFYIDKRYVINKSMGHGAYGIVVSATDKVSGKNVAIKKISKIFKSLIESKRTIREIKLLKELDHENVLRIVDMMLDRKSIEDVYVVSELMDTDLHQIIASGQHLSPDHVQYFVYQVLRGLLYIHSAGVLHRDLKPANLLVNSNCDLKIADFGLARAVGSALDEGKSSYQTKFMTEYVATRWYRAPEILLSWNRYGYGIDVWAVGCILGELCNRKPLFPGSDYLDQVRKILMVTGTPSHSDSEYIANDRAKLWIRSLPQKRKQDFSKLIMNANVLAINLLEKMLIFNPEKRISVQASLQHEFLKDLHDPSDEPIKSEKIKLEFEEGLKKPEMVQILLDEHTKFLDARKKCSLRE